MTGLLRGAGQTVASNRESGLGRPDILVVEGRRKRAVVIELKRALECRQLEAGAGYGLKQIEKLKYAYGLRLQNCRVLKYGIASWKKERFVAFEESGSWQVQEGLASPCAEAVFGAGRVPGAVVLQRMAAVLRSPVRDACLQAFAAFRTGVAGSACHMPKGLAPAWRAQSSKTVRETKTAVNREARLPREGVTAKPRTGPVPNW